MGTVAGTTRSTPAAFAVDRTDRFSDRIDRSAGQIYLTSSQTLAADTRVPIRRAWRRPLAAVLAPSLLSLQ